MPFDTPLRYPGGKGRLAGFMQDVIKLNNLEGGSYVEPYAGGAGIAISLLISEVVSSVYINDLNPSIYAFWYSVLNCNDELCQRIEDVKVDMDEWYAQRAIQGNVDCSLIDLAFSTFFLNRTNRSGIINGGVIGGKEQLGNFKIDARFNKKDLISRIKVISKLKNKITLTRQDAADFILKKLPEIPKRSLVYLDPPYYVKGKGLYQNHYGHADHEEISELVGSIQQSWVVTYDNVSPICNMYKNFCKQTFALKYSVQKRYSGTEILISKNGLILPNNVISSRALKLGGGVEVPSEYQ